MSDHEQHADRPRGSSVGHADLPGRVGRRGSGRTGALLLDRSFGPWFFGNLTSNSGDWLFNVTAAVVVYELTGSGLLVGMVSVAQFAALAVLSPWAGALSDRLDRRRLLLAGQIFAALSASALAVPAVMVGVGGLPGIWTILLAALGIGVGKAVAAPALNSLVPALVDDSDLEEAVALTSLTFNAGRALGPAGGGLLLVTLGAEAAFMLNALSFLPLIAAILALRAPTRDTARSGDRSVRAGLRHVRADPAVMLLLAGVATAGFAADPVITLGPPISAVLGGGQGLVAAMVSAFGVFAVPAAVVSGRLQRRAGNLPVARAGMLLLAGGLVLVALAPAPWAALTGFAAGGAGSALAVTSFTAALHRLVPDALRGRIMALWGLAFLGNRPIAAMLDGALADLAGPRPAMGLAVAVALVGAWLSVPLQRQGIGA